MSVCDQCDFMDSYLFYRLSPIVLTHFDIQTAPYLPIRSSSEAPLVLWLTPVSVWHVPLLWVYSCFLSHKEFQDQLVLARPRSSWKNSPETVFLAPSGGELRTHTHRLHLSLLLSVDHLSHEFTPALPVQVQVHRVNSSSPISISPTIRNLTTITTM